MSNITLVFFGEAEKVGRSQMILESLTVDVQVISKGPQIFYISYLFRLLTAILTSHRIIILNRRSCLEIIAFYPIIAFRRFFDDVELVYDMWEFYTFAEHTSFKSRVGTLLERFIITRANKVIVCNKYRRRLVKLFFGITNVEVLENFRILPSSHKHLDDKLIDKFDYLVDGALNFVITNSFSAERADQELIRCFSGRENITLTFIGAMNDHDREILNLTLSEFDTGNIYFVDRVPYEHLAKILTFFDFGVVNYSMANLNNKYCASGKIYEFLALGLPVLSSNNLGLKSLINEYEVGLSASNFSDAFPIFLSKQHLYRQNILKLNFYEMYQRHRASATNMLLGNNE